MTKSKFSRWSLLILLTTLALNVKSQSYIEVGSGVVSNSMPVYSSWNYSWSSLIYNHTDLGTAKSIIKIALNCTNGPKTVTNQKIYCKLTSNSVFANANYEDPLNNGYTLCFQGDLTFVTGWNEITLLTPIPYDGVQNLIIHWEDRWGHTYGPMFNSTSSSTNNNKNCGNDQNFPPPGQAGYLNPYPSSLTNMRFYYNGSGPVTPTNPNPADNATVVSVNTTLSWQLGANTTSYDLWFGTSPLTLSLVVNNATVSGAGTFTYTPPALLADSAWFYWKVIAKNGTQQESSPLWKFKTEVVIDQFPYNQGFEDSTVFNTYPVQSAWVITPDVSWYQYDAQQQSGQLCAKTSWYASGNEATIRSPKVLLPANHSISFYWRNTTANKLANHDTTYFEVTANGGQSWVKVDTLSPATSNGFYLQRIHSLNAFAGNNCYFRFRHRTDNSSSAANVYLDDISIYLSGGSPTLAVTPQNQNVTSPAGSTPFTVTSNSSWTAVSDQTWCSVTPSGTGNGTITANYTDNTTSSQRIAHINVTVSGIPPVVVTVTQSSPAPTLSVSPANQNVTSAAGTTSFTVTSNSAWTASSNQTWCAITGSGNGNGTITGNYLQNPDLIPRVATITVTVAGLTPVTVTVTQDGTSAVLLVSTPLQNVTYPAGSTIFQVTSNVGWTATSDALWCITTPSGSGNGQLIAAYQENAAQHGRTANITVTASGVTPVVVEVIQQAGPVGICTSDNKGLTVSPNPTSGVIRVNFGSLDIRDATVVVFNATGLLIMKLKAEPAEMTIDLSEKAKGSYLLVFKNSNITITQKIIVK
ncbi:MAG: T9SS type A sorting domain-containing protein [Bacteroidetes bacterium]|nr:T9SS type A sorting domain-containing protein [Bacteroidota bacterium]